MVFHTTAYGKLAEAQKFISPFWGYLCACSQSLQGLLVSRPSSYAASSGIWLFSPYYRAWKAYFNHYDVQWTLADVKNISFLFSRYSYRDDAAVEKFVIIDAKNADNPFKHGDEHFDAIILTTVLEHVHNPVTVIRSLTQHLRPGGVLVFDYIKSDGHGLIPSKVFPCAKRLLNTSGSIIPWIPVICLIL